MTDPAMAYWNNLPFQGFHYPDFLRITDGKYRQAQQEYTGPDPEDIEAKRQQKALAQLEARQIREAKEELARQERAVERRRIAELDKDRRREMEARRQEQRRSEWAAKQRQASDRRAAREAREKSGKEVERVYKRSLEEREHHRISADKWLVKNGKNVGNGFSKTILTDQTGKVWEFKSVSDAARHLGRSGASLRGANQRRTLCNNHRVTIQPGGKWRGPSVPRA